MTEREARRVLRGNIKRHGAAVELIKLSEECGELTQAACKLLCLEDGGIGDFEVECLAEEIADVMICMEQVEMIFPGLGRRIDEWIERKLRRLASMEGGAEGPD